MKIQSTFHYKLVHDPEYIHLDLDHQPVRYGYNIAVAELGKLALKSDYYPDRSFWITHFFKGKNVSREWLSAFQELIQKLVPENKINWESTILYLEVEEDRSRLEAQYGSASGEISDLLAGFGERQKRREEVEKKLAEKYHFLKV